MPEWPNWGVELIARALLRWVQRLLQALNPAQDENDSQAAAVSAISAIRASTRNELLSASTNDTVTAFSTGYVDIYLIDHVIE